MTVQQDTTEVVNMNKTLKNTLRTMIVLAAITLIAQGGAAAEDKKDAAPEADNKEENKDKE